MNNSKGWRLGSIVGTPIFVRPSALLIVLVFTGMYYPQLSWSSVGQGQALVAALSVSLAILASVFVHEVAHVVTAKAYGVQAKEIGLTFLGGHAEFVTQFRRPWHSALVALSGPAANLILAAVFFLISQHMYVYGIAYVVVRVIAIMNVFLGVFNLLPGLPLDGGNALYSLIWNATKNQAKGLLIAARVGQVVAVAWIGWAVVVPLIRGQRPDLVLIVWTVFIVAVLWSGATASVKRATYMRKLGAVSVSELLNPAVAVPEHMSVENLLERVTHHTVDTAIVVTDEAGQPRGYVDAGALMSVDAQHAAGIPVSAVSIALLPGAVVPRTATPLELMAQVRSGEAMRTVFVVEDGGRVVGVVWVANLLRAVPLD